MIEIIPMEIHHLDDVYKIETDSFSVPWSRNALLEEIRDNTMAKYFVAVEKEEGSDNYIVVGYAGMWHVVNEGHVTNIAVNPEHRRRGIGGMLLNKLIDVAYELGMIGMTLEVRTGNYDAQRLYLKNGFEYDGIRKNYYSDSKEDALVFWKSL